MARARLPAFAITRGRWVRQGRFRGIVGKARRHGLDFLRRWGIPFTMGLLVSRAQVMGVMSPFSVALFMATRKTRGYHPLPVAAGIIAGAASQLDVRLVVTVLLGIVAVQVFSANVRGSPSPPILGVATFLIVLGTRAPWVFLAPEGPSEWVNLGFEAVIAAVTCMVLAEVLPVMTGTSRAGARQNGEFALQVGLVGLGAIAFMGLRGLVLGLLDLQAILSRVLTLAFCLAGFPGMGAAAGVTAGALTVLGGSRGIETVALHGVPGLIAGVLRLWGPQACVWGYVAGALLIGFSLDSPNFTVLLAETMATSTFVAVIPGKWWRVASQVMTPNPAREDTMAREMAADRLEDLAKAFTEVSASFQEVSPGCWEEEDTGLTHLLSGLVTRVCGSCGSYRRCWERDFHATHKEIMGLFTQMGSTGRVDPDEVPVSLRSRCDHLVNLTQAAKELHEIHQLNRFWQRRMAESRELVSGQIQGITKILEDLARQVKNGNLRPQAGQLPERFLSYEVGVARKPTEGQVSGDHYLARELEAERLLLVLSDGMGVGDRAARESKAAVGLLERLLASGFDRDLALRTVNSILLLRSPEEVFATVDMVLVSLGDGSADFLKVGACPSFLVRRGKVKTIRGQGLPLGILSDVMAEPACERIAPGDILVMTTDGLLEAAPAKAEGWIAGFLEQCVGFRAADLAEAVVRAAAKRMDPARADDITVLVTRFMVDDS
jgi:stage II sporulation protein E